MDFLDEKRGDGTQTGKSHAGIDVVGSAGELGEHGGVRAGAGDGRVDGGGGAGRVDRVLHRGHRVDG